MDNTAFKHPMHMQKKTLALFDVNPYGNFSKVRFSQIHITSLNKIERSGNEERIFGCTEDDHAFETVHYR